MKSSDYFAALEAAYARNIAISRAKCNDYAGEGTDDAFANFRVIESLTRGKTTVEQGILTRMSDKLARIANLLTQDAAVKDESIADTLSDLANYAMILRIYISNKPAECQGKIFGGTGVAMEAYEPIAISPLLEQIKSLRK